MTELTFEQTLLLWSVLDNQRRQTPTLWETPSNADMRECLTTLRLMLNEHIEGTPDA